MAKAKLEKRDRGYGKRRRTSLAGRHDRHTVPVHSCTSCNPGAPNLGSGDQTKKEE